MQYYAVAVGRQQKVTSRYKEFRYLIKNYPDAQYIVTEDYEKAENYIRSYNQNIKKRPAHAYEENISYKPSFLTKHYANSSVDNTIWITSNTKVKPSANIFNEDFQVFVQNPTRYSSALSMSISTPCDLNLNEDKYAEDLIENKGMNYYQRQIKVVDSLFNSNTSLLLKSLTDTLKKLSVNQQDTVLICTDSHYLSNILIKDATKRQVVNTIPLTNLNEIILLYKAMHKFEKIFITRYGVHEKSTIHHKVLKSNYGRANDILEVIT